MKKTDSDAMLVLPDIDVIDYYGVQGRGKNAKSLSKYVSLPQIKKNRE